MLNYWDYVTFVTSAISFFAFFTYLLVYLENRKKVFKDPPLPKKLPKVSILVPAYNEEKTIAKTLKSLLRLNYPKNLLEIIAINDGSTDNTLKIMKKFEKYGVKVIDKPNGGKASALNAGLKVAKGDIIVCMDADSIVSRNALKNTVGYFNDPNVAAVASSLKVYKPRTLWQKVQYVEYIYNVFLRKVLSLMDSLFVVPGPFGLYRRSVLEKLGGWEEGNITEDMELTMRLQKAGYKIETSLNSVVYTKTPDTFKRLIRQRVRWYRGFLINAKKYRDMFFNPKFGNLGVFTLPLYIIFVLVLFVAVGSTFYALYNTAHDFIFINLKAGIETPDISLKNIEPPHLFIAVPHVFWLTNFVIYVYLFYISLQMSRERNFIRGFLIYFVSILFYPFVLAYAWTLSILKELRGAKIKWER
ncbi:MAG: glycosyltransferase [Candidatus Aenigmarchaeota archaeon]|jgi:cellulose synthase/poly-beta-1,6-N-acetylglucosamine synthase-like glycosyltransferase|nr:glycosyltransferase [Candidatus Aenigmarchaeota archaeon]